MPIRAGGATNAGLVKAIIQMLQPQRTLWDSVGPGLRRPHPHASAPALSQKPLRLHSARAEPSIDGVCSRQRSTHTRTSTALRAHFRHQGGLKSTHRAETPNPARRTNFCHGSWCTETTGTCVPASPARPQALLRRCIYCSSCLFPMLDSPILTCTHVTSTLLANSVHTLHLDISIPSCAQTIRHTRKPIILNSLKDIFIPILAHYHGDETRCTGTR